MKKNNICIYCKELLIYDGGEMFADIGDLCILCYFQLKLANLRQENYRSSNEAISTIEQLVVSIKTATKQLEKDHQTIEGLRKDLKVADEGYAALAEEFLVYYEGNKKKSKKKV